MGNKITSLHFLLSTLKYDIVAVSESWLGPKMLDSMLISNLPYVIIRSDRNSRKGGGSCLFISKLLHFNLISNVSIYKADLVCVDIFHPKIQNTFRLNVVYLPPNFKNYEEYNTFVDYLSEITPTKCTHFLLGDFNLPKISWDSLLDYNPSSGIEKLIIDFTVGHNLEQLIKFNTRKENILDLLFTNDRTFVTEIECLPPFGNSVNQSDHNAFSFKIEISKSKDIPIYRRNFYKANYTEINKFLFSIDWNILFNNCSYYNDQGKSDPISYLNSIYKCFCEIIKFTIEKFIPNKKCISKFDSYPPHIKSLFKYRLLLWKNLPRNRMKFLECSKKFDFEVNKFIKNKELKIFRNQKTRYNYFGSFLKIKKQNIPTLQYQDKLIFTIKEKCEVLSNCFTKNFNNEIYDVDFQKNHENKNILKFIPINKDKVYEILKQLRPIFNTSSDNIPEIFLKNCADSITYPLHKIFSFSVMIQAIPSIWKKAIVIPLPKQKNSISPLDYRPIAILCPTFKVFERIIFTEITRFLEINHILPEYQHGFRSKKSVVTQLIETFNDLTDAYENKFITDIIFFDLAKAFDKIPNSLLVKKLALIGIQGPLLNLIQNYLNNRSFFVRVENTLSMEKHIPSGVPQGSVGGPILFTAYISDILTFCQIENVKIKLFADDLKAYYSSKSAINFNIPLQKFIQKFTEYCKINGFTIAPSKCNVLHLGGSKNPNYEYELLGKNILAVKDNQPIRDLGIYLTANLKWAEHIEIITKKARQVCFALFKSIKSRNPSIFIQMFKTYVRPILEFGSNVFNPFLIKDIDAIEKIQINFLKIIYKRSNPKIFVKNPTERPPPYDELLQMYNLETLELRRLKSDLILFHKFLCGSIKMDSNNTFTYLPSKTRGEMYKIVVPCVLTPIRHNSFFVRVPRIYNKLPLDLKQMNVTKFIDNLILYPFDQFIHYKF